MPSLAAADWNSGGILSGSSFDDWASTSDYTDDAGAAAAITAGSVPSLVLLTGPEMPTQSMTADLEHVAELLPASESSLALVATLWSVPSSLSTQTPSYHKLEPNPSAFGDPTDTPSWMAYFLGLDQAFERSRDEFRRDHLVSRSQVIPTERELLEIDRQLEWERPIMPVAMARVFEERDVSLPNTTFAIADDDLTAIAADRIQYSGRSESNLGMALAGDALAEHSQAVSIVNTGRIPLLAAVSASAAFAGWLWVRSGRKRRLGLPGLGAGRA
jgi:hypothetical protein